MGLACLIMAQLSNLRYLAFLGIYRPYSSWWSSRFRRSTVQRRRDRCRRQLHRHKHVTPSGGRADGAVGAERPGHVNHSTKNISAGYVLVVTVNPWPYVIKLFASVICY
jgi:hypothetical protein